MSRPAEAAQAPAGAALDLHEGIDDPLARGGCKRWPEHQRLLSSNGELVRGRCRSTNLCEYCARLFAVETSEMLMLDALEHAPTLYAVLTARELLDRPVCRRHLFQLRKSLRKRWPSIEWAVLVEFQRRGALHLNLLIKGVPVEEAGELHASMSRIWCSRVDALPRGQFVGEVNAADGLVRYVTQHFMKPAQAPPIGWRGHRYSATRGYLARPAAVMRQEARQALRHKRVLWRVLRAGHTGHDAELIAHELLELAAATTWQVVDITSRPETRTGRSGGPESLPGRPDPHVGRLSTGCGVQGGGGRPPQASPDPPGPAPPTPDHARTRPPEHRPGSPSSVPDRGRLTPDALSGRPGAAPRQAPA